MTENWVAEVLSRALFLDVVKIEVMEALTASGGTYPKQPEDSKYSSRNH